MKVREFVLDDKELFLQMCQEFYSSHATSRDYDEALAIKTFNYVMSYHENLWGFILLDGDSGANMGYALVTSYWCNEEGGNVLVLDELYISQNCRRKGYGSLFLQWMENRYCDTAVAITLEVLTTNISACGLYAKEGYTPDGFTTYTKKIGRK